MLLGTMEIEKMSKPIMPELTTPTSTTPLVVAIIVTPLRKGV